MGEDRINGRRRDVARVGNILFGADELVGKWVAKRIPGLKINDDMTALGIIGGDQIVGGVVYDNWNGIHCEAAIAGLPGKRWLDRASLHAIFFYPFVTLNCEAVSVSIPSTNLQSLNLATKLGFEPEALIKFAAPDGSTLVVLKMFRDTCRWIKSDGKKGRLGADAA